MSKINITEIPGLDLTYHIENTPLGVIVLDHHGFIRYWSARAEEIFGWTAEEIMDTNIKDLSIIYKKDLDTVDSTLQELRTGMVQRNQSVNRNCTKSGKEIYCEWYNSVLKDESGLGISILSMVQDITERIKADEAIQRSQNQLSLIFNSAIDPMWLLDIEEGYNFRFEYINKSFIAVTGLAEEKVIGHLIEEVMPKASHALVRAKYMQAIRTRKVVDYIEVAQHPAGQKVGEIRVIPVDGKNGQITKIIGIANDITENWQLKKQRDEDREAFNKRIIAAAVKGQEKERANVSLELHDNVNQVLTTVKLYIEMCYSDLADPKVILPKCATLLNDTINEIRDISKMLSIPPLDVIGIQETLAELVSSIQVAQKMDIELKTGDLPCNLMDGDLHLALYRIVQEQLTNIIKYAEAAHVLIRVEITNDQLSLLIQDNGKGFDTTKKRNGIGITNIINRVQMFNGTVEIQSQPGKGCTLLASFPILIKDDKCFPASLIYI
ncbi:MAG: PAS domain-containing sensor histidine kinase [Flavisolibacter sp.]